MRITIWRFILGLVACLFLAACDEVGDAEQIARAIAAMEEGIENQQTGPVLEQLSEDFRTDEGLQSRQIHGLMLYHFRRFPSISVFSSDQVIRVEGQRAEVTQKVLLLGGKGLLPERGRRYSLGMRWQKSGGDWRLTRLKWRRSGEE